MGPHESRFGTTHWSLVIAAGQRDAAVGTKALAELCQLYWYPLYAFFRRREGDEHRAGDLTQEFFARLLEKEWLRNATPERGRFRAFLLTAARNFHANVITAAAAQKRGGGRTPLSFDLHTGEERYRREPSHTWTAERLFERRWALELLEGALERLGERYAAQGKAALFAQLKPALTGDAALSYAEVGAALDMSEGAIKVAAFRLRQAFREVLLDIVAQTVADPADVEDELRELFRSLAS